MQNYSGYYIIMSDTDTHHRKMQSRQSEDYKSVVSAVRAVGNGTILGNGDIMALRIIANKLTMAECVDVCAEFSDTDLPRDVRGVLNTIWGRFGDHCIKTGILPSNITTLEGMIKSRPFLGLMRDTVFSRFLMVQLAINQRTPPEEEVLVTIPERYLISDDIIDIKLRVMWVDLLAMLVETVPSMKTKVVKILKKENEKEKVSFPYKEREAVLKELMKGDER